MADSSTPTLDQIMRLAEVTADLRSLLMLDSAWTSAETLAASNSGSNAGVAAIGDRVDQSLVTLSEATGFLRDLLSEHAEWFDAQVETGLAANDLSDAQRAEVTAIFKGDSDSYAANGITVVDDLDQRIPWERSGLNAKVDRIRNGGTVETDLDAETVCGIATGFGMASLTACVVLDLPAFCISGGADLVMVMALCPHS